MANQQMTVNDVSLTPQGPQSITLETLPVELLAEIFSELDLDTLVTISCLSRRFRAVTADASLNPWRRPILRNLRQHTYEKSLYHLSVRHTVPRQNWIEILTFASPSFLLLDSTLPNLRSSDWEECFRKRFLPSWTKWKRDTSWRETFMKILYRVWHRSHSSCTSDESWTKYIMLNRNGSANELEAASRNFNPLAIFHELKVQNNLAHLPTRARVVLQLMDVRIIALGVINHPTLLVNRNAHTFLCPPGFEPSNDIVDEDGTNSFVNLCDSRIAQPSSAYRHLLYPTPSYTHRNYPMYTPGGGDQRWHADHVLEEGKHWVGGLMVTACLHPSDSCGSINHAQFASFTWQDFLAIAPWMEKNVTKCIYGQGLAA